MEEIKKDEMKIVVAGHICLDITPVFPENKIGKIEETLIPGRLLQMGSADVHIGGAVANTGLALKILGADVVLMGKIGNDAFGKLIYAQVEQYHAQEGMVVSDDVHTSYSVVIAPQGIDRIFLHHSGANDAFYMKDLDFLMIKNAGLFHFGYPPLMKSMYENNGQELICLFQKVKEMGVSTSLDMAAVDEHTMAGQVDWEKILRKVLPFVDFFMPSIEELAYMIDRPRFLEWVKRADGRDITSIIDITKEVEPLAQKLIDFGAKIVLIKCGVPGLYLATAEEKQIKKVSKPLAEQVKNWGSVRHFEKSYKPKQVLSGTGAGDTSIAAFLYAVVKGYSYKECLQLAAATGASCVECYDALSGLKTLSELQKKIESGWEKQ